MGTGVDVEVFGTWVPASVSAEPLWDPKGDRIRGVIPPAPFGPDWSAGLRRASDDELRAWLDLAVTCCDLADGMAMGAFRRDMRVSTKPDRTLVTEVDRAIERLIRERIQDRFPGHGLIGEEEGEEEAGASVRWYIDPIDGTHNFIRGVPLFGTLLAVERDGELQAGVISAPALGERWVAWRGGGAWNGERRLSVSDVASLGDAQLLYGSRTESVGSGLLPGFDATIAAAWRERGFGDFWGYALVAEGAAEAMIETGMHSWDLAAPLVLVEEAGGRLTSVDGERSPGIASCVASNGLLHDELLGRLRADG